MNALYPPIEPYHTGNLGVSEGHRLYFEQVGNADGIPVVFIHGGPGSGCNPTQRRFFAADRFRAILYDQRGAGRSTPAGSVAANNTHHLLADLERLREELDVERWLVFAGSWGATLGLLYAQRFPERVLGMVLRGTFLARPTDLAWFFGAQGVARIFPEDYRRFLEPLAAAQRSNPAKGYLRLHQHPDSEERLRAARAWSAWDSRVTEHSLPRTESPASPGTETLLQRTMIASHYAAKGFFLGDSGALIHPQRLAGIPGWIIHGRRDLVVPVENATILQQHWPSSKLEIIEECGHIATEPATARASIKALEQLAAAIRTNTSALS